jgi:hypothetical protein
MRPYQWEPAPPYRPPTLWERVKESAGIWVPILMLGIADVLGV